MKIAFYLCTSNQPKGVARSFKDFPPASLRHSFHFSNLSGHASATHEELKTIPNDSDMAAVWGDSEDGRDLIAKIKDTPVACVQTENQFIFIYEME